VPTKQRGGSDPPPRPDIGEWAHELRTDFLQCRDFGHSWRPYTARWDSGQRAYESQLRCSRCRTIRTRWIGARGEQLGAHYDYADGYTVKGVGRLTGTDRDALRLQSILRVLPEDTAEEA
jgi:hypothetical protein